MKYLYLFFFLVTCSFLAAQNADSLNIKHTRAAKADTTAVKPKRTFNPVIMKAAIDSLILNNRANQQFAQLRQTVFLYNSGYHVASLPEQDLYIVDHGFTVKQNPFSIGYELQKRITFSNYVIQGRSISFDEILYPYPAALSSTEFGIGGQDMNYAHLQIKKNELVGLDSLYGKFDALFQRGYWGGVSDNSTIEDIFFKYALKQGNIQLHANSLDWDIPRFQRSVFYPAGGNPLTREKSVLLSLYWENKWVNAGVQGNHANWTAHTFEYTGGNDFWQILLDKKVSLKPVTFEARYEHFGGAEITSQYNQSITSPDLKDLGSLVLNYDSSRLHLNSTLRAANPKALGYDNTWLFDIYGDNSIVLNVAGNKSFKKPESINLHYYDMTLYSQTTLGYRIINRLAQSYQFDLGYRTKHVTYFTTAAQTNDQDGIPFLDVVAHVPIAYHSFKANCSYKFDFNAYFKSVLDINAYYDLPYNNRILFGFSHTYRDQTLLIMGKDWDTNNLFDEGYEKKDNLLDAYAGLQITRQFDIRFTVKNILNQYVIFNTSLMPITYLLNVKWDFVN